MKSPIDRATQLISTAFNIVFIGYPLRTSLGVLVGLVIGVLAKVLKPLLDNFTRVMDLSRVSEWDYIVLGVAILHIQTFILYVRRKGSVLGESEEKAFEIIKRAKAQGVPEWRIKKMYLQVCERVLKNVELKEATKEEIRNDLRTQP